MTASPNDASPGRPRIARLYRLQWEEAQESWVLLFPEGMVKLNQSAGEILKRCTGEATLAEIVGALEAAFATSGLGAEVEAFLDFATAKRWVEWPAE